MGENSPPFSEKMVQTEKLFKILNTDSVTKYFEIFCGFIVLCLDAFTIFEEKNFSFTYH